MNTQIEMTHKKYGRWFVLQRLPQKGKLLARCVVRCSCGTIKIVKAYYVRSGHIRSCGCLHKDVLRNNNKLRAKHGHAINRTLTSEYRSWSAMRTRCCNPSHKAYKDYAGRGITICPAWFIFKNFLTDMGTKPIRGLTLERIDNNKGYYPENCRWATRKEQCFNRRNSRHLTAYGITKIMSQWARILQIPDWALSDQLKKYSLEQILSKSGFTKETNYAEPT
jgi:hypothetical protein